MKNLFSRILVASAATLALAATPALANPTGWGNFDPGATLTINTIGQAGNAGTFAAAFDGTSGEAGAEKDGGSSVDIRTNFSTCEDADCADNSVSAKLRGFENGMSWAKAYSNEAGRAAIAENFGQALAATSFGLGINACPGGCPAPAPANDN